MALRRLFVAGTLSCLLYLLPAVLSQEFTCYASTDCHGAVVSTLLPQRGECCTGQGLSFTLSDDPECRNCFSMEEFCSEGSKYYMAFFDNLEVIPILSRAKTMLQVNNIDSITENVLITYESGKQEMKLDAGSSHVFALPTDIRLQDNGKTDRGVCIQSEEGAKLLVTADGSEFTSSDTFQLLPCVYLPSIYEYYAVSVAIDDRVVFDPDGEEIISQLQGNSVLAIVASEVNTQVTIITSQYVSGNDTRPGTEQTIILNEKESFLVSRPQDLTGSRVIANKPVSVFSGHECGNMPSDLGFCDHMVEQIPPTATWGKEFFAISFMGRPEDQFKAVSSRENNNIAWTCTNLTTTSIISDERDLPTAGSSVEFSIERNHFCRFTSRFPVLLVQFSIGGSMDVGSFVADPSMTIIPPVGQYRNSYMLNYFQGSRFVEYFVNIILLSNGDNVLTQDTLLNGNTIEESWTEFQCEDENGATFTCAYGVQIKLPIETEIVSLSHNSPDAQVMGIVYSVDYRTGQATFSGMTQKPIALDEVTLDASEYSQVEGGGAVEITLLRSGDLLDDVIVPFRAHSITGATNAATPGVDFMEVDTDILFPALVESVSVSVALGPDNIFPGEDKVFEVYLGAALGVFVSPIAYANVTIIDPDPNIPVMNVSFEAISVITTEGDGFIELTLLKTEGGVGPVTVTLIPVPGSAESILDYDLDEMNITFEADETVKVVQVVIVNDEISERTEEFAVVIMPVEGVFPVEVVESRSEVIIEILDNDRVILALEPQSYNISESAGVLVVNLLVLKGSYDRNVNVSVSALSDTAISGVDFVLRPNPTEVIITPLESVYPLFIEIVDDSIVENKEFFTVRLSVDQPISPLNITITDDDYVTMVMTVSSNVTSEAAGGISVNVSVDAGDLTGNLSLGLSTVPLSANTGVEILTNSELLFMRSGTTERQIEITDNDLYDGEEDRMFAVILSLLGSDFERVRILTDRIVVNITDNETRPDQDVGCILGPQNVTRVRTAEECCLGARGFVYEISGFSSVCVVIGFDQERYTISRGSSRTLSLRVVRRSLAQNLTLTITTTAITAAAGDYAVANPYVKLMEGGVGDVEVAVLPGASLGTSFRLDIEEESGILPRNVFFRGAEVIIDFESEP